MKTKALISFAEVTVPLLSPMQIVGIPMRRLIWYYFGDLVQDLAISNLMGEDKSMSIETIQVQILICLD